LISICIPTYNTDCTGLLKSLNNQIKSLDSIIEIIVFDDGSTLHQISNKTVCSSMGFVHIENKENLGRVASRKKLAEMSKYQYLLFIDADMIPENPDYIKTYIEHIASHPDVQAFFGGYSYDYSTVTKNLRYRYGKKREQKKADFRNKNPYKLIFSGNMAISKKLFAQSSKVSDNVYGLDILLSASLKKSSIPILHIDNETQHHGIDANTLFLSKVKSSAVSLRKFYEANIIEADQNNLIDVFEKLKKYKLHFFFCNSFLPIGKCLYHILRFYGKPLILFDWYRLYYFSNPKNA
jgi:glycosyltransferase involved in cell wall biosynthesis